MLAAGAVALPQLASDGVMKIARKTWLLAEGTTAPAFSSELVQQIYEAELGGGKKPPTAQRASVLEVGQARFPCDSCLPLPSAPLRSRSARHSTLASQRSA